MTAAPTHERVDALIAADPYLTFLGLSVATVHGELVVVLPPLERHLGIPAANLVHGGVVAAFLEATASLHLRAVGHEDVRTIEFSSDFVRAVPLAITFARASVVRSGRRFASLRVDAWQDDPSRLVATGHGRFLLED